jgi:hypothetical protein
MAHFNYLIDSSLEERIKTTNVSGRIIGVLDQDSNSGHPRYQAGTIITQPKHYYKVSHCLAVITLTYHFMQ